MLIDTSPPDSCTTGGSASLAALLMGGEGCLTGALCSSSGSSAAATGGLATSLGLLVALSLSTSLDLSLRLSLSLSRSLSFSLYLSRLLSRLLSLSVSLSLSRLLGSPLLDLCERRSSSSLRRGLSLISSDAPLVLILGCSGSAASLRELFTAPSARPLGDSLLSSRPLPSSTACLSFSLCLLFTLSSSLALSFSLCLCLFSFFSCLTSESSSCLPIPLRYLVSLLIVKEQADRVLEVHRSQL